MTWAYEALRQRLVELNARLSRCSPFPWALQNGAVIAPAVRASWPPDATSGRSLNQWSALDNLAYYGGELVCESCRRDDAELIAHAPADLALFADATQLLIRDQQRLRFLMDRLNIYDRREIDMQILSAGSRLFTLARAELAPLSEVR